MKRIMFVLSLGLLWPWAANAEINYNYVQAGHAVGDLDTNARDIDASYSGYNLALSGSFLEYFIAQGSYDNTSVEGKQGDIRAASGGVGGRYPLNLGYGEATDVYGTVSYEEFTTYFSQGDGYGATVGLRWQATDTVEVQPSLTYLDYGTVENDGNVEQGDLAGLRYGIGAVFKLSDRFAVNTEWRTHNLTLEPVGGGPDADVDLEQELRFGLRYNWM